jgi:hypothetical protein
VISERQLKAYLNNDGCPTNHKPIDAGLGFTCDEGVVELVLALNRVPGIKTKFSCEEMEFGWVVPRGHVGFFAETEHRLLDVCLQIKENMLAKDQKAAWSQTIHIDNYMAHQIVFAELSFPRSAYDNIVQAIQDLTLPDSPALQLTSPRS